MRIEVLVDVKTILGEGPLWDVESSASISSTVSAATSSAAPLTGARSAPGTCRRRSAPWRCGRPGRRGHVARNGFHFLDFKTGDVALIIDPERDKPANRLNDGKVDKRGRFIAGSMDTMEEGPNGALYRLDPDLSLHKLDDGIIVSNGPCWSPDGRIFYFADTWTGEIWAYDYDLDDRRGLQPAHLRKVDRSRGGAADGSTVDAEGCLWNALVYDGSIVRYTPDGKVDRIIDMPVKKVTSVMFGGPNLDILYVTSMAKPPLPRFPGDGVLRGSLFAIHDLGVRGVPEPRFAG